MKMTIVALAPILTLHWKYVEWNHNEKQNPLFWDFWFSD